MAQTSVPDTGLFYVGIHFPENILPEFLSYRDDDRHARWPICLALESIIFPPLPSLTVLGDLYPVSSTRNFMNYLPRLAYP
jgi:hypothetical protein